MIYLLKGKPIALKRPRFSRRYGMRAYDSQVKEKEDAIVEIRSQSRVRELFSCAVRLDVIFYMPIPSSYSQKKKDELEGKLHVKRPDLSNMVKFVEDCITNVLYDDDSQISVIVARKIYSKNPRTEFLVIKDRHGEKLKRREEVEASEECEAEEDEV